jgi:hypothetical protein
VEEFITDHNSIISEQVSGFDLRHDRLKIGEKIKLDQQNSLLELKVKNKLNEEMVSNEALMKRINDELKIKEARIETKFLDIGGNVGDTGRLLTLEDITLSPDNSSAWSIDGSKFTVFKYSVKKEDQNSLRRSLETAKSLNNKNISTIHDHNFTNYNDQIQLKILIAGFNKITLPEVLSISGAFELKKAQSILHDLLLVLDDLNSVGVSFIDFNYDLFNFQEGMEIDFTLLLIDALVKNEFPVIYPRNNYISWIKPHKPSKFWSVGALFLFMIFGNRVSQYSYTRLISNGKFILIQ